MCEKYHLYAPFVFLVHINLHKFAKWETNPPSSGHHHHPSWPHETDLNVGQDRHRHRDVPSAQDPREDPSDATVIR